MRVTVLGKSPSWPDAGGACSGYLVQEGSYSMLLDCGVGVFAKLRTRLDYRGLDAVLITHLHSDHFFDLVPFSYALTHSPRARREPARPALWVPPGATASLRAMLAAWGSEDLIEGAFALEEYDPEAELALGPLRVRFCEVPHFTQTFAARLAGPSGELTYGADCAPNPQLEGLAGGSDVLLLEATLLEPEGGEEPGHMSAAQAGELGRRAGVRRLVLTHFTDELDAERIRSEGASAFGAAVELAHEGAVYEL